MNPCRCESCCPGDPEPTWSAAYRMECLARYVADLPTVEARRAFLAQWKATHRPELAADLEAAVRRVWNESKAPTPGLRDPGAAGIPTVKQEQ